MILLIYIIKIKTYFVNSNNTIKRIKVLSSYYSESTTIELKEKNNNIRLKKEF